MQCVEGYRSKPRGLTDSDSSDDDSNTDCWKRNKPKQDHNDSITAFPPIPACNRDIRTNSIHNDAKRKVNKIWTSVIEEREVSDVFKDCGLKRKPISLQDRSCESYDFRRKYLDTREDPEDPIKEKEMDTNGVAVKNKHRENGLNLSTKKPIRLKHRDALTAQKITRTLNEKKHFLIERIVYVVGAEKAMELLKQTEDLEEQGGMKTKNNLRRRTPGGVYIQLLKAEKLLTRKQYRFVFAEEKAFAYSKKMGTMNKRKKKPKKLRNRGKVKAQDSMDVGDESASSNCASPCSAADGIDTVHHSEDVASAEAQEDIDSEIEDGEILDD